MSDENEPDEDRSEAEDRRATQDEVLIAALAIGKSYEEAGALAGVVGRTVGRRMTDPGFSRRVRDRRRELASGVAGRLTSLTGEALDALRPLLKAEELGVRLKAIQIVLGSHINFRRADEMAADVAEIKALLLVREGGEDE